MKLTKKYLLQTAAIHNFMNYAIFYEKSQWNLRHIWERQIIHLNEGMTKFFGLTNILPNGEKTTTPQLLIQNEEKKWFSIMSFDKIVVWKNQNKVVFITEEVSGNEDIFSTLPSIGISITIKNPEIFKILLDSHLEKMIVREMWKDDNEKISISFNQTVKEIDIEVFDGKRLEIAKTTIFHDLPEHLKPYSWSL